MAEAILMTNEFFDLLGGGSGLYDPGIAGLGFALEEPPIGTIELCVMPKIEVFSPQGYTHGHYLTVPVGMPPEEFSSGSAEVGIGCLLSERNFAQLGTGYLLGFHPVNGQVLLKKMTAGVTNYTVLDTRFISEGYFPLSLTWLVDPYAANWVYFRVFLGGLFLYGYQDFVNPYTSGIAEGCYYSSGGSGEFRFSFTGLSLSAEV